MSEETGHALERHGPPANKGAWIGSKPIEGVSLVLAGRGCGKTTHLQVMVMHALKAHGAHVTVWDRMTHWEPRAFRGAVILRGCSAEDAAREAIRLAPTTLVCDEVDLALPSSTAIDPSSALYEILHVGRQAVGPGQRWSRNGPVAFLAAARRPANIRTDLRALTDTLWLGRMWDPDDLAKIESMAGRDVARSLPTLPSPPEVPRFHRVKLS